MKALVWTVNIIGWPLIHILVAKIAVKLPLKYFSYDNFLYKERSWERGGEFYSRRLRIKRWKSFLPDGAPWLGGFKKKKLEHRDRTYIRSFILEARRAEAAHWCMFFCLPIFFLWNPRWACLVMTAYAAGANFPCILAQRYNRLVLLRILRRMS